MENYHIKAHTPVPHRKPYTKPVLSKVRLAAEEAVLGNCKLGSTAGAKSLCQAAGDGICLSTQRS